MQILEGIENRRIKLGWSCLSRADVVDEELLARMGLHGCHTIQFGVETANEQILRDMNKHIPHEKTIETFRLCRKLGIRTLAHFILGLPGETEASIEETIRFAIELNPDFASFNLAVPRLNTDLRERLIAEGVEFDKNSSLDVSVSYPVFETPSLSKEALWELRRKAIKTFYGRPDYILRKLTRWRDWKMIGREAWGFIHAFLGERGKRRQKK